MDKQRAEFEAWFASTHMPETVAVYSYGNRVDANIKSNCWLAWQACAQQYEIKLNDVFEAAVKAIKYVPYTKQYEREEIAISMVEQAMEQSK